MILDEYRARNYILGSNYLSNKLNKLNIISDEEIEEHFKQLQKGRENNKELQEQQKENKHKEYLRFREKFGYR